MPRKNSAEYCIHNLNKTKLQMSDRLVIVIQATTKLQTNHQIFVGRLELFPTLPNLAIKYISALRDFHCRVYNR